MTLSSSRERESIMNIHYAKDRTWRLWLVEPVVISRATAIAAWTMIAVAIFASCSSRQGDSSPARPSYIKTEKERMFDKLLNKVEEKEKEQSGTLPFQDTYEAGNGAQLRINAFGIEIKPAKSYEWVPYSFDHKEAEQVRKRLDALEAIIGNGRIKAQSVHLEDPGANFGRRSKLRVTPDGVFRTITSEDTKSVEIGGGVKP
jgi:hypothetical protein